MSICNTSIMLALQKNYNHVIKAFNATNHMAIYQCIKPTVYTSSLYSVTYQLYLKKKLLREEKKCGLSELSHIASIK